MGPRLPSPTFAFLASRCVLFAAAGGFTGAVAGCGGSPSGDPTMPPPVPYQVTATLDVGTHYQTMQGFGGAVAFYINWLTKHPQASEIYDLVFADLGLEVLRIGDWYQNQGPTSFQDSVSVVEGARASLGHDPLVLLSSWSPPASLKSNGMTKNGGTLIKDADGNYDYADFAQWWASSLAAYQTAGVFPDFMSIQNEPDYVNSGWETNLLDPKEDATNAGYDKALQAVTDAITAAGIDRRPQVIAPETSGIAAMKVENYVQALSDSGQLDQIDGIAHHLYNGGTASFPSSFNGGMSELSTMAASSGKPLMMTEYGASADLLGTAWLIHNALTVEGVSAYYIWSLTWAPPAAGSIPGGLVTTENPMQPSSWKNPSGYAINDAYYAVRHFSKWIQPGWQRVGAVTDAGPVRISAYASPDGQSVTMVLMNTDTADHAVTVDPGTFTFASSAVYRTAGTDERTAALGALADGGVVMPASSLVTITLGP
jgi:glucuronoarabinoxylan endo-1,4-beta-xylanase